MKVTDSRVGAPPARRQRRARDWSPSRSPRTAAPIDNRAFRRRLRPRFPAALSGPGEPKRNPVTLSVALTTGSALAIVATIAITLSLFPGVLGKTMFLPLVAGYWLILAEVFFRIHQLPGASLAPSVVDEIPRMSAWALSAVGLTAIVERSLTAGPAAVLLVVLLGTALVARTTVRAAWRRKSERERLILIGQKNLSDRLSRKLELERTLHAEIVGQIDILTSETLSSDGDALTQELIETAVQTGCDRFVVCPDGLSGPDLRAVSRAARELHLKTSIIPTLHGAVGSRARLGQLAELTLLEFDGRAMSGATALAKRAFDIVSSSVFLMLLSPMFAAIALAIRLDDGGPVFYRQERGGKNGEPFMMFKFRTMATDAESRLKDVVDIDALADPMYKIKDDPRITRIGAVLRKTSLDELPQLINVLRGEMSLVGPRPEDIRLVRRYGQEALAIRCGMRPGITGPMQVHGRGDLSFQERLQMEQEYLENHTLGKDLRIIALTMSALLPRRGAY